MPETAAPKISRETTEVAGKPVIAYVATYSDGTKRIVRFVVEGVNYAPPQSAT